MEGQRFTRLIVLRRSARPGTYYDCRCDCGVEKSIRADHLRCGRVLSCGCLARERARQRIRDRVPFKNMDGRSKSPEYKIWMGMLFRCRFSQHYGGRGITVCDRWRDDFLAFLSDMGPRPSTRHSLDRIDNDGNYEPGNCRWATRRQQMNNTRQNRYLTFRGRTQTIGAWAQSSGIHRNTLDQRLAKGWSVERALTTPAGAEPNLAGLSLGGRASGDAKLARTHCTNGHEYAVENTYWRRGSRYCRTCHRLKERRRRDRHLRGQPDQLEPS